MKLKNYGDRTYGAPKMDRAPDFQLVTGNLRKNSRERLLFKLQEYNQNVCVDVRVHVDPSGGHDVEAMTPTKKGVCITLDTLPRLIAELQETERIAIERGLLKEAS